MTGPLRSNSRARFGLYAAAFVLTAGFRYLVLRDGFPNDHFIYITGGWQMLFGEWPTRDWVDPGLPLMFFASAVSQAVFGPTLFAEAVLVSCAFGLAAAMTLAAVLESGGSVGVALAATVLEVAVMPRSYGYPKVFLYAAAFLCFYRYVNRPGPLRLCAMVVAVAVAFLFRHDHGLFLALGGALTVLLVPDGSSPAARIRRTAVFAAGAFAMVLPYLLYVEAQVGLGMYFQTGIEFTRHETTRMSHVWPAVFGDEAPFRSALVYELYAIPVAAAGVLLALGHHPRFRMFAAYVVPVAVVALIVNYNFIRDPLITRTPDAILPGVLLGAWLFDRALQGDGARLVAMPAAVGALALFSASVLQAGKTIDELHRAELVERWNRVPTLFQERTQALRARLSERQIPTRATGSLRPFLGYVDRCTTSDHRLLIGGFLVEVPFFARRRFAAGQEYFGGSFVGTVEGQRAALYRLRRQTVPFALIPSDYASDFEQGFPIISGYLHSRYTSLTTVTVTDETSVRILVDSGLTPTGRDVETGWPCFLPVDLAAVPVRERTGPG